ncbi:uncharacterized protein LOC141525804 [Cotesia typhae]|uniref:uncharacterized protein LOC141525804 n=1 Tax=Cotesia typhae TaxID=2053667 RepID=UPI003D69A2D7
MYTRCKHVGFTNTVYTPWTQGREGILEQPIIYNPPVIPDIQDSHGTYLQNNDAEYQEMIDKLGQNQFSGFDINAYDENLLNVRNIFEVPDIENEELIDNDDEQDNRRQIN